MTRRLDLIRDAVAAIARGKMIVVVDDENREDVLPMPQRNTDMIQAAFTVSVDLAVGIGTGISAPDRAATLGACAGQRRDGPSARPDAVRPPPWPAD